MDLNLFIRQWFDQVWNQGQESAIDQLYAENGLAHDLNSEGPMQGKEAFKQFFRSFHQAFPDLKVSVEDALVEGERVAYRCTVTGTHAGEGLGIAPTNKPIHITGMGFTVVKDGKIVEGWNNFDFLSLYHQLGVISMPATSQASSKS